MRRKYGVSGMGKKAMPKRRDAAKPTAAMAWYEMYGPAQYMRRMPEDMVA